MADVFMLMAILLLCVVVFLHRKVSDGALDHLKIVNYELQKTISELELDNSNLLSSITIHLSNISDYSNEFVRINSEREDLQKSLERSQHDKSILEKRLTALEASSQTDEVYRLGAELSTVRAQLADAVIELDLLRVEAGRLKQNEELALKQIKVAADQYRNTEAELTEIRQRWVSYSASVLKPVDQANIVVTVFVTNDLPSGVDLDLYVQDPEGRICCRLEPSIWQGVRETAMLLQSEDLQIIDDAGAKEIYYSSAQYTTNEAPYLVYAMLRETQLTNGLQSLQSGVSLFWRVEWRQNQKVISKEGSIRINRTGVVTATAGDSITGNFRLLRGSRPVFHSLVPVCGFTSVDGLFNRRLGIIAASDMPKTFRGFVLNKNVTSLENRIDTDIRLRE